MARLTSSSKSFRHLFWHSEELFAGAATEICLCRFFATRDLVWPFRLSQVFPWKRQIIAQKAPEKKFPKSACFQVDLTSSKTPHQTLNIKTTLAEKLTYTSREQHIRNTYQTLNEVEIVLFIRKQTNAMGLKFLKKWRNLHRSNIKTNQSEKIISNLTCLFLDLIFAFSRAISCHNARVWDKLQCCSACNKMA